VLQLGLCGAEMSLFGAEMSLCGAEMSLCGAEMSLCGAEMSLLLDPFTVLLCVRLFLKAMCASVCICLCEAAFYDDGKTSLKLLISFYHQI
jgi:hypothetical protein